MIKIYKNIFVGNEMDYEKEVKLQNGWIVVHACKEPYHRQAVGYSGRACSKTHPEYLLAKRNNHLMLNLVDVDNPDWISNVIVDETLKFLDEGLANGNRALIHCNQGKSRSAGLGLLYLAHIGEFKGLDFISAEEKYTKIYPLYQPAGGIRGFCMINWDKYNL